ncbi:MAG: hypothetical protein ABIT37_03375 [Luteolibacter sp.]
MTPPLSEEKMAAISELLFRGQKIEAIRIHREQTGFGLKEAKDEVGKLELSLRAKSPEKFTAAPTANGCFAAVAVLFPISSTPLGYWIFHR